MIIRTVTGNFVNLSCVAHYEAAFIALPPESKCNLKCSACWHARINWLASCLLSRDRVFEGASSCSHDSSRNEKPLVTCHSKPSLTQYGIQEEEELLAHLNSVEVKVCVSSLFLLGCMFLGWYRLLVVLLVCVQLWMSQLLLFVLNFFLSCSAVGGL